MLLGYGNQSPLVVTLELPYLANCRNVSCIPAGVYDVTPYYSKKFGNCFKLSDPPGRSGILIHAGNSVEDTRGCILVGTSFNMTGIVQSKNALFYLLHLCPYGFKLNIRNLTFDGSQHGLVN
jgi:hypothetical protein